MPPLPEVMLKERAPAGPQRMVTAQPASFHRGGTHHGPALPIFSIMNL